MAGSAYCKIEVSIIFKYYPKIKLGCYYFTMYHVKLSLQHNIHEDYDNEILNQRLLGTLYFSFSMLLSPHYAKPELFPTCFCFSETEFVVLETDGWMLVWRGRTEREEGKDIKSYHRQSCLACVGAGVLTIRCGYRLDRQSLRFTTKVQLPTNWGLHDELLERKNI